MPVAWDQAGWDPAESAGVVAIRRGLSAGALAGGGEEVAASAIQFISAHKKPPATQKEEEVS